MSVSLRPDTPDTRKAINTLARYQMRTRLLNDIRFDLAVCDIEGWDKREYINQLQDLLNGFETGEKPQ